MSQLSGAPGGAPIQPQRRNAVNDEKKDEKQSTRCTLTSDPSFPHALLRIHMPYTSKYGERPTQLFVVDQSGSMAGGPWTQILSVLTMVVNHSRQQMQSPPMCITYHSTATVQTAEHVLTQRAGGSTNFISAFKAVQDYIKTCTNKAIVVTFMTDGQETDNKPAALTAALAQLRFFIANCGKHVTVHAIGYTPSHDVNLLQSIRAIGTREGMYRYAESRGLEEKFLELFDWVDTAQEIHVDVDGIKHTVNAEIGDGELDAEVWIPKPTNPITSITVQIGTERHNMDVTSTSSNPIFIISCLGRIPVTTQAELDDIQSQLNRIKMFGHGMTRTERQTLFTLRSELQERLDAYHQIMAELARTSTSNVAAVAKLQDLAFAHTFTKASRKRRMDQRAAKNQGEMSQIDARLNALTVPSNAFDGVDVDEFTCFLTQSNVKELMDEAKDDVIGFGLLVERSEFVVDAPSMITLRATSTTIVSKSACEDAIRHRIHVAGHDPSQAHGGFVTTPYWQNPVSKDAQSDKNGTNQQSLPRFTIGTSGEAINAFLPIYICPAHAERVMVLLKPLLGYFFALDPLSFKEDQYLAMFTLLGHLLQRSSSQRDEWIICEYTKMLKCVMIEAKKYLGYDLVENFITSLAGRVKGSVGCQNLLTIVGWAYVNMPDDADALTENGLKFPLLEELIRRTCENMFHGAPKSLLDQHVRELLYGETIQDQDEKKDEIKEETDTLISTMASLNIKSNDTINIKYAEWAKYKVGYKTRAVAQPVDTSVDDEVKATTPNATSLVIMEMNDIIRNKIRTLMTGITSPWSKYISTALLRIGIHPFDIDTDAHMLRPLLIQSIRLCTNDHVNHAISHNTYVDVRYDQMKVLDIMHQQYQAHVIQQQNNIIEHIRTLAIARRLVATDDIWSFVGRLMATCPTRGGMIWDAMLALIMDQTRPKSHGGYCWPLLEYKIRSLMTGQLINTKTGKAYDVLAQGQAWFADKRTCERIHEVLGDDAYLKLELAMRGRECGHVYRMSDIPNRHGHCNSKPNLRLRRKWGG